MTLGEFLKSQFLVYENITIVIIITSGNIERFEYHNPWRKV